MNNRISTEKSNTLFERVVRILEQACSNVVRTVNSQMVIAYWMIGHEIVEEEQQGEARAEYGKRLIEGLSRHLTERYGKGFSVANLRNFRQFYVTYQKRSPKIHYPAGSELRIGVPNESTLEKRYPKGGESVAGFYSELSWSHYRAPACVRYARTPGEYQAGAGKSRPGQAGGGNR